MDPKNKFDNVTKEEFQALLDDDLVFDDVSNRVFALHDTRNKRMNEQYPLMIKLETSLEQIKYVLNGIDRTSFVELRDLQKTPAQLASKKLQKISNLKYSVVDDLRELIGNENMKDPRFCGTLHRLID